jgi:hypothetical protein
VTLKRHVELEYILENNHVVYACSDFSGLMATWTRHIIYDGWTYPPADCHRHRNGDFQSDYSPKDLNISAPRSSIGFCFKG